MIDLPGGHQIGAISVERLAGRAVKDGAITWAGSNGATVTGLRRLPGVDPFDREWLSQPHWTETPDKRHPGGEPPEGQAP